MLTPCRGGQTSLAQSTEKLLLDHKTLLCLKHFTAAFRFSSLCPVTSAAPPFPCTSLPLGWRVPRASQVVLVVKNWPASAEDGRDVGSMPWSGRSPEEGNGSPLQYSCLENPMDGGAWWATIHRVIKSQTRLKRLITHTHTCTAYICSPPPPSERVLWEKETQKD